MKSKILQTPREKRNIYALRLKKIFRTDAKILRMVNDLSGREGWEDIDMSEFRQGVVEYYQSIGYEVTTYSEALRILHSERLDTLMHDLLVEFMSNDRMKTVDRISAGKELFDMYKEYLKMFDE